MKILADAAHNKVAINGNDLFFLKLQMLTSTMSFFVFSTEFHYIVKNILGYSSLLQIIVFVNVNRLHAYGLILVSMLQDD